ncbi:cysteine desulfuration protein SufE [Abditibacteriota bacterium]|nr:cysteine desulfuration protein SufE [Abditibacteriota bacterium]
MQLTPEEQGEELVEAFDMFDSWEDRYRFLIDMGRSMEPLFDLEKTDRNRVTGCQSNVWLVANVEGKDSEKVLHFRADSDSTIVRGLIALLTTIYNEQTPRAILDFDIDSLMQRLGLDQHLSIGRRNGMAGMVARIKTLAVQNA